MPKIVAVHGIGQQFKGEYELQAEWLPALRDGLARINLKLGSQDDFRCAFYGDLFRIRATKSVGNPPYDANDVSTEWETAFLILLWTESARAEEGVSGPSERTKLRTPNVVQRALNALSNSRFFVGLAESVLIGDLKQVRTYLHEDRIRLEAQQRVAQQVDADTRILIGHSLGSIVAYEALCNHPEWSIDTFITLGSPLGIPNLIFHQLRPIPLRAVGSWPRATKKWVNIADQGDIVALVKKLGPIFDGQIEDHLVNNGTTAHDVKPYLSAEETGHAVARGLMG